MKEKRLKLQPQSAEPRSLQDGDLWFRTDLCEYRHHLNGETVTISKDEAMRLFQGQKKHTMTPTLKPTGPRNFTQVHAIRAAVAAHRGPLVVFASGWGMYPGQGALTIARDSLLRKLDDATEETFYDFRQEGDTLYIGLCVTFLDETNAPGLF